MENHTLKTYFYIVGNFDSNNILSTLQVTADEIINKGDILPLSKKTSQNSRIKIGVNTDYNVDVNAMLKITLKDLILKTDILLSLKNKYNLEYYLVIVPKIVAKSESPNPLLSVDEDIVEFLYLTKTKMDLDYYVY